MVCIAVKGAWAQKRRQVCALGVSSQGLGVEVSVCLCCFFFLR